MATSTAIATVRSDPPRARDELRELLRAAVQDEPLVEPDVLQVTAVFSSDKHVLGLQLHAEEDEAMVVLDRVEARLEALGVVAMNHRWRLLVPPGA
ncbi:MAG: hypothetical protein JWL64_2484 [Frankiales bacterium]|nr:hypothetical protein [Frankiales bacterium]